MVVPPEPEPELDPQPARAIAAAAPTAKPRVSRCLMVISSLRPGRPGGVPPPAPGPEAAVRPLPGVNTSRSARFQTGCEIVMKVSY